MQMNKEIISTMLSADSPALINGEGRGGKPYFTKQDAMYCVSGMPQGAWEYMQYVDILNNNTQETVYKKCCDEVMKWNHLPDKEREKILLICKIALVECRLKSFSNVARCSLIQVSERQWYRKYSEIYGTAQRIYNDLDNQAGRYIAIKLGKISKT